MEREDSSGSNRKKGEEKHVYPPAWAFRLLHSFCPSELCEEIEGDLVQRFRRDVRQGGAGYARRRLMFAVIRFFRPGILLRNKFSMELNQTDMIRNYVKIALRNLAASKFYSTLNITGLTIGLTVGLLIVLWINNELSYDRFHSKAGHIYGVNVQLESSGSTFVAPVVQPPVAAYALREVPEVQEAVRISVHNDFSVLRYQDKAFKDNVLLYTDASFFRMFDFRLLKGNVNNPFPGDESVIVTESAAARFFGNEDPLGKEIIADNKTSFVVSGVVADFPENSTIDGDILFSTGLMKRKYNGNGFWKSFEDDWGNYAWHTFVQLQPGAQAESVAAKLTQINVKHQPHMKPVEVGVYKLQPLTDMHLYAPDGSSSVMQTVKIFSVVALLILLIASINYVNLSTARAVLRSREVSVRKIIGAARGQLLLQFITETSLFFLIALALSCILISALMPLYSNIAGKQMEIDLLDTRLWQVIGGTLGITLLASSIYPALLLSAFKPVQALKGKLSFGMGNTSFRKVLVVCQFAFSVGLIIATIVISRQLDYIRQKELGYDKSFVFSVGMNNMKDHYETAREELLAQSSITGVTAATNNILNVGGSTLDVEWDGKDPEQSFFIHPMGVDKNFLEFFKLELVQGSGFSGAKADSAHFILNETAIKETGIQDPVGKRFRYQSTEGTIIGVVKDFHFTSLKQKIEPFIFYYQPVSRRLYIRTTGENATAAISAVENIWQKYNEGFLFDYTFLDDAYDKQYKSDQRTGLLFNIFAVIAIVISCLGLLGLATYTAQIKVKEIGIRKVLGASAAHITAMLSKDFLSLVAVSIIIAIPVAGVLMHQWLQNFVYHTELQWWIFALSGLTALLIACLTISVQSIRAALENPVKNLKNEG